MNFKEFETAQKLRGGYYTDPDIAEFLSAWALEKKPQRVLEPSVGDGAFVDAISGLDHASVEEIVACEIDGDEAQVVKRKARSISPARLSVHVGDFLEWSLPRLRRPPEFDAAVGNPPFIRYQYLEPEMQDRAERIFSLFGLPFTKHTNAWVPFVISSLAQLRPGGRLAMVVPAELLHVIHAKPLRDFLLAECSRILVLDPEGIWFGKTLQGVVLLLAEKATKSGGIADISVQSVKHREDLSVSAARRFSRATYTSGSTLNGKWMLSLLGVSEQTLVEHFVSHPNVKRFKQVASVDVGIVTGANKFFLVPDETVEEYGLHEWAHPMFGRSEHARGVIYDKKDHETNRKAGLPTNFISFKPGDRISTLPASVKRYIKSGEAEKLHERYKCRIRTPWYSVPSVYTTPVGMLKRSHHYPRLILNRAGAYTTDTAYRIQPKSIDPETFVACFVNSLTMLTAELEGRHYGGGVLELVPSEIEKLLVPITALPKESLKELDRMVRSELPPEDVLSAQDQTVLRSLGVTTQQCQDLLNAWVRLRQRRQRSGNGKET